MDLGLRKAWVEELRRRFAGKRVKVLLRGYSVGYGEFKEIFLTGGNYNAQDEIRICVLMDGNSTTAQYRVQCSTGWNDNEIRWGDGVNTKSFIAQSGDGEVKFELDNTSPFASKITLEGIREAARRGARRKGLAPGLTLVDLRGRKGVAPALRN